MEEDLDNKKVVYATMVGDLFHAGHLKFIKAAKALGNYLIIGLHPDDVVKQYKRQPIISFEDRKAIIEAIREVDLVVEDCMDFKEPSMFENLKNYKVDLIVHGTDWLPPLYKKAKELNLCEVKQINTLYTSTSNILRQIRKEAPHFDKPNSVIVSAGDAITAKLVEQAGFDGIWVSSFEVSARLGLVDNGTITMTEMLEIAEPIAKATNLPVIIDVDNGYGGIHNFIRAIKEFEKIGCAGVCIEDNLFPKQNSLFGGKIPILPMEENGKKIHAGKSAQQTKNFMIIARTEALIRGYGIEEAIKRAEYYARCGADRILIHTRDPSGQEAFEITKKWKLKTPLVIVPTKFPHIKNQTLFEAGYSIVVLANQTERVKLRSIKESLEVIKKLDNMNMIERGFTASLDELRDLTPIKETDTIDQKYEKPLNLPDISESGEIVDTKQKPVQEPMKDLTTEEQVREEIKEGFI